MMSPPPPPISTAAPSSIEEEAVACDQVADQSQVQSQGRGQSDSQTQTQTQSTQQASQENPADYTELWGLLMPCNPAKATRIELKRETPEVTIGRKATNTVVLDSKIISSSHCKIVWDGKDGKESAIKVTDLSSNGTFINRRRIGKGKFGLLHEGDEIAFGKSAKSSSEEDFPGYVYRHTASGKPSTGLYAFYDLNEEVGHGTFAHVFRAMHRSTGLWYAVKVLQTRELKEKTVVEKEISILKSLKHDNVCGVEEVFVDSHNTYIVLEYISGGDLLDHILRYPAGIPEPEAQDITYQLCEAMAYIHTQGVLHRDLKPENILLTSTVPPQLKIVDFGLAKAISDESIAKTFLGTPWYLAPEVAEYDGYDDRADSYSVGAIVFSMLTGERAHTDASPEDAMLNWRAKIALRQVQWTFLDQDSYGNPRTISEHAKDFTTTMLQHYPADRMRLREARFHAWLLPLTEARDPAYTIRNFGHMLQQTHHNSDSQESSQGLSQVIEASLAAGALPHPARQRTSANATEEALSVTPEQEGPCVDAWTIRSRPPSPASTLARTVNGDESCDSESGCKNVRDTPAPLQDRHNVSAAERGLQAVALSRPPKRRLSALERSKSGGSFEDMPASEAVNPRRGSTPLRAARGRRRDGSAPAVQAKRSRRAAVAAVDAGVC